MTTKYWNVSGPMLCSPEGEPSGSSGSVPGQGAAVEEPPVQEPVEDGNPFTEEDLPPLEPASKGGHKPSTSEPAKPATADPAKPALKRDPVTGRILGKEEPKPAEAVPPAAEPPKALTPEEIARISAQAAAEVHARQPAQAAQPKEEPQLSEAEYNQLFNIPATDAKLYEDIFGMVPDKPERVQALHNYGQAIARQAVTMANLLVQRELKAARTALEAKLNPMVAAHQKAGEDALYEELFTGNPDIKEHLELVNYVVDQAKARNMNFGGNKQKAFSHVAGEVRRLLGKTAPQPTGSVVTQPQQQQPTTQRRMTGTMMPGAPAGGGSATTDDPYSSDAKFLFG